MRGYGTMTSKGQVTIPVEIRRRAGLSPSDKIEFDMNDKGEIKLRRVRSILEFAGSLPPLGRETSDFEDIIREAQEEAVDRWLGLE